MSGLSDSIKGNMLDNMFKVRPMENYRFYLIVEKGDSLMEDDIGMGFSNVSSFGYSVEVEEIKVGGVNDRKIVLPKNVYASNVTCQRGLTNNKGIYTWINEIKDGNFNKRNMLLMAFGGGVSMPFAPVNEAASGLTRIRKAWSFEDVLPIKWEISGFDAISHSIVVETLELSVGNIKEVET